MPTHIKLDWSGIQLNKLVLKHKLNKSQVAKLKNEVKEVADELRNSGASAAQQNNSLNIFVANLNNTMNNAAQCGTSSKSAIRMVEAMTTNTLKDIILGNALQRSNK